MIKPPHSNAQDSSFTLALKCRLALGDATTMLHPQENTLDKPVFVVKSGCNGKRRARLLFTMCATKMTHLEGCRLSRRAFATMRMRCCIMRESSSLPSSSVTWKTKAFCMPLKKLRTCLWASSSDDVDASFSTRASHVINSSNAVSVELKVYSSQSNLGPSKLLRQSVG